MINVGIIGVTGYAGEELIRILLNHPQVRITNLSAKIDKPLAIEQIFPKFSGRINLVCTLPDIKNIIASCELVFLALPHTVSMGLVPKLLKAGKKVIDLSADYRLKNTALYEKFYKLAHKDKPNIKKAVYGLPELYRVKIKGAKLLANPGCYPTAAILGLAPLVALDLLDLPSIIIDAKSGVSGAGRRADEAMLFAEVNEDFRAYKINVHQHSPEINQELSGLAGKKLAVTFVPHLLPLNKGILETIYVKKAKNVKLKAKNLQEMYKKFYQREPFVRIKKEGEYPRLKDVVGTNFCDIGIADFGESVIIVSAIDNLLKGASGQAVQNMNIMYNFPEAMGLL
ncbi:MAG: N-acetyl-gamma-glutamyl-phosphate reductase [Candidatus Omnitrophica bacterium]|nr:N-acetyl-gamma-glutamyl-phosphate reductase [Candidatus Omnitrophota bacterium]